jgi:hypothetical protein
VCVYEYDSVEWCGSECFRLLVHSVEAILTLLGKREGEGEFQIVYESVIMSFCKSLLSE